MIAYTVSRPGALVYVARNEKKSRGYAIGEDDEDEDEDVPPVWRGAALPRGGPPMRAAEGSHSTRSWDRGCQGKAGEKGYTTRLIWQR
jgi:hypothetical protein